MVLSSRAQNLLDDFQKIMAVNEDEIMERGIAQATTDRIIELRQRIVELHRQYGNLKELEMRVEAQGVSADDHAPYTDLLEWRAAHHELEQLTRFLEMV
jgi:hypothetical protein